MVAGTENLASAHDVNGLFKDFGSTKVNYEVVKSHRWSELSKEEAAEAARQRPAKSLIEAPHYACSL